MTVPTHVHPCFEKIHGLPAPPPLFLLLFFTGKKKEFPGKPANPPKSGEIRTIFISGDVFFIELAKV